MSLPQELIAAHELGHALVARETGLRSGGIKLTSSWFSGDFTAGYCLLKSFKYEFDAETGLVKAGSPTFIAMLTMTTAGEAAAEYWLTLNDSSITDTGASGDHEMFAEDAAQMSDPPTWEDCKAKARDIVLACWSEIVELTPVLLERGRMSGGQVA